MPKPINKQLLSLCLILALSAIQACVSLETDQIDRDSVLIPPDGKYDTAYYSNLAMELEGDVISTLAINVSDLDTEARERLMRSMDHSIH